MPAAALNLSVRNGGPADRAGCRPGSDRRRGGPQDPPAWRTLGRSQRPQSGDRLSLELLRGNRPLCGPKSFWACRRWRATGPTGYADPSRPGSRTNRIYPAAAGRGGPRPVARGAGVRVPSLQKVPTDPSQIQIQELQRRVDKLERRVEELELALAESRRK